MVCNSAYAGCKKEHNELKERLVANIADSCKKKIYINNRRFCVQISSVDRKRIWPRTIAEKSNNHLGNPEYLYSSYM